MAQSIHKYQDTLKHNLVSSLPKQCGKCWTMLSLLTLLKLNKAFTSSWILTPSYEIFDVLAIAN